jgi:hypothetical protein
MRFANFGFGNHIKITFVLKLLRYNGFTRAGILSGHVEAIEAA